MRYCLFILLLALTTAGFGQDFFQQTEAFLNQHVDAGKVNYTAIHQNPAELSALVERIGNTDMAKAPEAAQVAFYVNAYNILVIHQLIEHYPTTSPKDIVGFFDSKNLRVGGMKVSLNSLEHMVLAGVRKDPRFHFALVCGALGCPKLHHTAAPTEGLEAWLDARTREAFDDPAFIRVDGNEVGLSEIFNWYRKDFGGAVDYINRYRSEPLPENARTSFYTYDWTINDQRPFSNIGRVGTNGTSDIPTQSKSNVQTFTPSVLLRKGQTDITVFNSVYTQTSSNWMGEDFSGFRETFVGTWIQITHGVSKNARINLGLDINIKASAFSSDDSFNTITEPFAFRNDETHRTGVTTIGPKIKIAPFRGVGNFSIESILWLPVGGSKLEGSSAEDNGGQALYFLDWNRPIWWNRFYFDKVFGQFQLFTEVDLLFRIPIYENQKQALDMPLNLIVSWFPTSKSTLYVLGQHVNRYRLDTSPVAPDQDPDAISTSANYSTWGVGGKYQLTPKLNVEVLYSDFWRGVNSGLGETYNLGLKYIF